MAALGLNIQPGIKLLDKVKLTNSDDDLQVGNMPHCGRMPYIEGI